MVLPCDFCSNFSFSYSWLCEELLAEKSPFYGSFLNSIIGGLFLLSVFTGLVQVVGLFLRQSHGDRTTCDTIKYLRYVSRRRQTKEVDPFSVKNAGISINVPDGISRTKALCFLPRILPSRQYPGKISSA